VQEKQESNVGNSKMGTLTGNFPRIFHFGHRRAETDLNDSFSKWRRKKKSLQKQKLLNTIDLMNVAEIRFMKVES